MPKPPTTRSLFPPPDWSTPTTEDVCANRHGGAETSVEAHERNQATAGADRGAALAFVRAAGDAGATSKEIAQHLGKPLNAVSGRCTELLIAGLVRRTERRRGGCAVLEAV